VIFPVYNLEGKLISASGRLVEPMPSSYFGRSRWTNWTSSDMQDLMWPLGTYEDGIWINLKDMEPDHIILCEGINDAYALNKLTGITAISMFGKKLSDSQIKVLIDINPEHVTIAFDHDAINEVHSLSSAIVGRFKKVTIFPYLWEGWKKYDFGSMIELKNNKINFASKLDKELRNLVDVDSNSFLKSVIRLKLGC
jgi:hypothetical protein